MNFITRFLNHQIGYLYKTVATAVAANKDQLIAQLSPIANQGAAALKQVVASVLGSHGVLGVEIEAILDRGIDNLDANTLSNIQNDVPGFVDKVVAQLEAHAAEMLAS